ncbi:MAG TPA: chromosomal replication initiator protein DnaA [Anaerolineae bacterium]|nr:chromosomal replication initiator protein DnaA [Anaerolineae bacterium]MCB0180865.1 chromosomal replication initiator protein DnaA [Anaerolineae bacterium]MCB0222328.1 chromosomal replication initiator protein DnaA [Anaerolineae bacterium]HRV90777.1 chromosomal replication initiator protein DnaA [Anaerolineae bacterium]
MSINTDQVWQTALGQLQLQMTRATFDTWVKDTYIVEQEDDYLVIGTKNVFAKDWLENRLSNTISRTLASVLGRPVGIEFIVDSVNGSGNSHLVEEDESDEPTFIQSTPGPRNSSMSNGNGSQPGSKDKLMLNNRYTFDQFIVGASNRLAHAASLAVAEKPADAYNPLFLYGGVGLGKTHLLQAVAHFALKKGQHVIYTTSEAFTNDLINAIRTQSTENFRERYRNTDFLLIDDIQFIAGKESTQEEFFHTFNTLHSSGGQIVLTSDRPPKAITTLEERLRSRFEWGLLADIQPPDLETRIAILKFKAESQNTQVPGDVLEFVARRAQNNIRELEGALTKVIAHSHMLRQEITLDLAEKALQDIVSRQAELTVEQVIVAVAEYYRMDEQTLIGRNRSKDVSAARQMAMYLAREETGASLPHIGEVLGGRDHTTIMHGWEKIASRIEENDQLRREMLAIREIIYSHSPL